MVSLERRSYGRKCPGGLSVEQKVTMDGYETDWYSVDEDWRPYLDNIDNRTYKI